MERRTVAAGHKVLIGFAAVPLVVLMAACGSSATGVATLAGSTASPTASASKTVDPKDATLALAKCMRQHGVDMPDPSGSGGFQPPGGAGFNPQDPKFQKAIQACRSQMPSGGGGGGPSQKLDAAGQERMIKLAGCMRKNGVNMPDPQFDSNGNMVLGGSGGGAGRPNMQDAKTQTALKACQQYVPSGRPGASPTGAAS
jgi:hypothetical protein